MSAINKNNIAWILFVLSLTAMTPTAASISETDIADALGFVPSSDNNCGGFYLDAPFSVTEDNSRKGEVQIAGNFGLYALQGTSTLNGAIINRSGQQITADKAYVYRNPNTHRWNKADMIGDVRLREPNTLIISKHAHYDFETGIKTFNDNLYRTALVGHEIVGSKPVSKKEMATSRRITGLTAWGQALQISQHNAHIYELDQASFTTCPPISPAWRIKGSHMVLNKNTGRGSVTHARLLVKSVPIFYFPYIDFSIDKQRKTGFLWPTFVVDSSQWGQSLFTPFYLNLAPNYDMLITPGIMSKRGTQLSDRFRYLTTHSTGSIQLSVLPSDREFAQLQKQYRFEYSDTSDPTIQAELTRLLNSSTTRRSFSWQDNTIFNEHWSSKIDYSYAGDDYYMQDFGKSLNDITQNQLLQNAALAYKGQNWNFLGRLQTYQTLHPIIVGQPAVENQYRRFPQLILNADYPNQRFGLEYFIQNEVSHFDIRNTPGTSANLPIGNRMHMQPGVSLPLTWPYLFINPRFQVALSDYQLYQIAPTNAPGNAHRAVPIFDLVSGLAVSGDTTLFHYAFEQTVEPQIYYTYIPYRNQASIPVFDTTVNTLTYDQIFNYNRFSGIDRIGDANQIGWGVTSRLIDSETGFEKARLGVGELVYFSQRKVTLCNDPNDCTDNPTNPDLDRRLSPLSGVLNYKLSEIWNLDTTVIWNPITKQLDNSAVGLNFQFDPYRIARFGYNYARGGDILSGVQTTSPQNNLKVTDFSFTWPLVRDISMVGKWSQNWNHRHLQNLLYGLQYDSCCWAARFVGGRAFIQYQDQAPQYNTEYYFQIALKGLGNIGSGNASNLLNSFTGDNSFG